MYRSAWEKDQELSASRRQRQWAKPMQRRRRSASSIAVQIHGGRGVLAESMVDRLYRAIRPLRIYEGATEVQYLIIAKELLKAADMAGEG